jgi:hypothetical protein
MSPPFFLKFAPMGLCPISLFSLAACGGERRKRSISGIIRLIATYPEPQQRAAALCTPACKSGRKGIFELEKNSG